MKKWILQYILFFSTFNCISQSLSFTIHAISPSSSITCITPSVNLIAFSNSIGTVAYTWNGPGASLSGTNVLIGTPGIYTVTATSGTTSVRQTVSIGINTVQPGGTISPLSQTISCGSVPVNVTAVAAAASNILHTFKSSSGAIYAVSTQTAYYFPGGPGTYTHFVTDVLNGCFSSQVFSVTAQPGFPTASLVSSSNYTIGCSTSSVTVVTVTNAATTPTAGTVSYSIQGPPTVSGLGVYTISTPGAWTITVKDNISLCETRIPFTITQNTVAPDLFALVPKQILDCYTQATTLEGFSSKPSNSITWLFPGTPGGPMNPINVVTNLFAPTSTLINTFTLLVTDNSNKCRTNSVIPMYQNVFPPLAKILASSFSLNCTQPVILTNASMTGIPPNSIFPNVLPVVPVSWEPNSFMLPITNTWVAMAVTHTLTVKDLNNGCTSSTSIPITDSRIFPVLESPPPFLVICPDGTVTISPIVVGNTTSLSFSWQVIPNAAVSGINTAFLTTNAPGPYTVTATNTISGCATKTLVYVYACVGIDENNPEPEIVIYPNPVKTMLMLQINVEFGGPVKIIIRNLSGEIMYQEENNQMELDVSQLIPGLYFLELNFKESTQVTKFIKE